MAELPVNYQDAVLAEAMNGKRRVRLVPVGDGVYEVEDVTEYNQEGNSYGASDINNLNKTVNGKLDGDIVIDDRQTALLVNKPGVPVGCQAYIALNNNLTDSSTGIGFRFGIDSDGNYGYIKDGADTVTPFKSGGVDTYIINNVNYPSGGSSNFTVTVDATKYNWYLVAPSTNYSNVHTEYRTGTIAVTVLNSNTIRLTLTPTSSNFFPYGWNGYTKIIGIGMYE